MPDVTVNNGSASVPVTIAGTSVTVTVSFAAVGPAGAAGEGVPTGGTTGQILAKASGTNYDTEWITAAGTGDMLAAVYDPNTVAGDAFSMGNMVETATAKILTADERTKLSSIESGADVTDAANVTAAGALMDSEVTNLAAVKAFDPTDYATAAQGLLADSATQPGDNISTLTNDAGYITATLTDEQVQDIVGAMVSTNTETLITVTYQDIDGTLDFVVDNDLANYSNATSDFATNTELSSAVSTHAAITSGVHGISAFGATLIDDANAAAARTTLDVDQAGTDNSTDVTIAAGRDYITITGQELTLGAVDLTADVTGALPVSNGGTGATTAAGARTALDVDQAGTDNSTDVTLVTTSHDYLSIAGQAITLGAIDLAADVTGDLPLSNLAQASAASKLLGRGSAAGGGDFQEITLGTGLSMSGATLSASASAPALNDVTDVTITNVATGEALVYTGAGWENQTLAEAGIAAASDFSNVENTALSTWSGSTNLTTLGTGAVDAITEIDSAIRSSSGTVLATETYVDTRPFYLQAALTANGEAIATGTNVAFIRVPNVACTLTNNWIDCDPNNEPSAAAVQVDANIINRTTGAGTSLFSSVPSISTGANTGSGTIKSDGTEDLSGGELIGIDIDQGSDGKDLIITLEFTPT